MTLREAIEERIGIKAKIGSGNAFVYCGEITEDLPEIMDRIADEMFAKYQKKVASERAYMDRFEHVWATKFENRVKDFHKKIRKLPMDEVEKKHKKFLKEFEEDKAADRKAHEKTIAYISKIIEEWTRFTERKVKEIYPSLEEGEIIIFKGKESGKYWTFEEYEEDNR